MSVITAREHDHECVGFGRRHAQPCFNCNKPASYPFVHWRGHTDIVICSRCCSQIKMGLMADMIQVAANLELISLGYHDAVLVRGCASR
jgi:hypothetical protein